MEVGIEPRRGCACHGPSQIVLGLLAMEKRYQCARKCHALPTRPLGCLF
jgi:hypothetical protein